MSAPAVSRDTSAAELLKGIIGDVDRLLQQELALAREEVREAAESLRRPVLGLILGAVVAAFGSSILAVGFGRAWTSWLGWPTWTGYAMAGAALMIIGGGVLIGVGRAFRRLDLVPRKTVETLGEQVEWLRHRKASGTR